MDRIASGKSNARSGAIRRSRTKGVAGAFALILATSAPLAQSRSASDALDSIPVDDLKRIYLWCTEAAMDSSLDKAGIMQCSIVYEVLKQRAFGGDFLKMLTWSQANPIPQGIGQ